MSFLLGIQIPKRPNLFYTLYEIRYMLLYAIRATLYAIRYALRIMEAGRMLPRKSDKS